MMKLATKEKFVLASASPRRKELFSTLGLPFSVLTSNVEETSVHADSVREYVQGVALLKTRDIAEKCDGSTVIGADTIVALNDRILHKPKDRDEAIEHLQLLSNNQHSVLTAVAIIQPNGTETVFVEETTVFFKKLSHQLIEAYVETGDPFDKAGGYGIQTSGALLVDHIEGDYNNVVGLPLASLFEKLVAMNLIQL